MTAQKRTKREKLLAKIEKVVAWQALVDLDLALLAKDQVERRPT